MSANRALTGGYVALIAVCVLVGIGYVGRNVTRGASERPSFDEFAKLRNEAIALNVFDSIDPALRGNALVSFIQGRVLSSDVQKTDAIYEDLQRLGWIPDGDVRRGRQDYYARLCRQGMTAAIEGRRQTASQVQVVVTFTWSAGGQAELPEVCGRTK